MRFWNRQGNKTAKRMKYDLFADFFVKSGDVNPRYTCNLGEIHIVKDGELEKVGFKRMLTDEGWFLDYSIDNATLQQIEEITQPAYVSEVMDIVYGGEDFERICISALEVEVIDDEGNYPPRGVLIGNVFAEFKATEALSEVNFLEDRFEKKRIHRYFNVPYKRIKDYYNAKTQSEVIQRMREDFDSKDHEWTFEELMDFFESGIDDAVDLACRSFFGMKDLDGNPAILHALAVGMAGKTKDEMIAGFLHDVLEDTDMNIYDFDKLGFNYKVVKALELLTHDKEKNTYEEYIDKIILSKNELARTVKINDLKHNIQRAKDGNHPEYLKKHEDALAKLLKKPSAALSQTEGSAS